MKKRSGLDVWYSRKSCWASYEVTVSFLCVYRCSMVIGGLQYGATGGAGRVFISGISKSSRALMILRLMVGCLISSMVRSSFVGFLLSILKVGPFGRVEARA